MREHVCVCACAGVCVHRGCCFTCLIAFLSFSLRGRKSDLIIVLNPRHSLVSVNINCANFLS